VSVVAPVYESGPLKARRNRRTREEIRVLDEALYRLAERHQPITVRGLFYRAVAAGLVPKDETLGYDVVQRRFVDLRRGGVVPYAWIADGARTVYRYDRYASSNDFLRGVARLYRMDYQAYLPERVEVWIEKDAMSGVLWPITDEFGINLYVTRGFPSLTYLENAAQFMREDGRPTRVYVLTDFDPSGLSIADRIERELPARAAPVSVHLMRLAVTADQIRGYRLPTRPTKRADPRAPAFLRDHGNECVELDAFEPNHLRQILREALEHHISPEQLAFFKKVEEEEQRMLALLATRTL
jgi:hypothetical protein